MDRVLIRVTGQQSGTDGAPDSMEFLAEGRHYLKSGKHYVLYDDNVTDEGRLISTTLKFTDERLTLIRKGGVSQLQEFYSQGRSVSQYHTAYGSLELAVETKGINISFEDVKGEIHVEYALFVNGQWQSDNELHIEISPAAGSAVGLN